MKEKGSRLEKSPLPRRRIPLDMVRQSGLNIRHLHAGYIQIENNSWPPQTGPMVHFLPVGRLPLGDIPAGVRQRICHEN